MHNKNSFDEKQFGTSKQKNDIEFSCEKSHDCSINPEQSQKQFRTVFLTVATEENSLPCLIKHFRQI